MIKKIKIADFCDEGSTVEITTINDQIFYVQTVDGEYRYSLGCLVTDSVGDEVNSVDLDDDFINDIIKAAEKYMEENSSDDVEENPRYINKDSTPYERRYK